MARRVSIGIAVLLTAAAIAAEGAAWRAGAATGPDRATAVEEARLVRTVDVPSGQAVFQRSLPGVTRASQETKLAFRVPGPIDRFDVKIGLHRAQHYRLTSAARPASGPRSGR